MAHNPIYIKKRNEHIRNRFRYHRKKNPNWTIIAVIKTVSEEAFLSPATIGKILKEQDVNVPDVKTICKYSTKYLVA
ncbi:hypothetical protein [Pinibacter soli]|uniref:Uncharacterized protein n=1 Tax=Pinibacter soli TaxID=3044211 RepID=A0ABT6R9A4_9BACT|nr:hypothetical protein [Pinibacter soli]MDI3319143.1 hypothetical protein [Pinibacter soli]